MAGRFVCACAALQECGGGGARAEALGCLQQLHMFCAKHVNLPATRAALSRDLASPELVVRRAALCCLRQLSQKEAAEVCRLIVAEKDCPPPQPYCGVIITETGLLSALLAYLDLEKDEIALSYTRDTLTCCLMAPSIRDWLTMVKRVMTVRLEDSSNTDNDFDVEADDDQMEFHAESEQSTHPAVQPRWPTRVFAMECIQKIMTACEATGESAHFDLVKAKEKLVTNPNGDYLSLHLSDLVRMAFVGATGESDSLRLSGLKTLQMIVQLFARAPEPDFDGHLLLEQYQAQVGAALRPAFSGDTASHVTAAACDVCSAWIGCGVARDINDLRRVHQLLVSSLDKLNMKGNTTLIYNESMATLEKLSILKAWAEVYIVAMVSNGSAPGSYIKQLDSKPINNQAELAKWRNQLLQNTNQIDNASFEETSEEEYGEFESKGESLLRLVAPELDNLGANWLAALRDHALLSLPPEFSSQLPHGGGAFYHAETAEASRAHYARAWPSLLYAAALRFNADIVAGQTGTETTEAAVDNKPAKTSNGNCEFFQPIDERFHLLFGICMEALCAQRDTSTENTISVLLSLVTLLDAPENRARLLKDRALAIELCQIIHRTGLTQESIEALLLAVDALKLVIVGAKEQLHANMEAKIKELAPNEASDGTVPQSVVEVVHTLGEGGPTGDLPPAHSLVFTALEVALCFLVRRLPALSPLKQEGNVGVIGVPRGLGIHGDTLLIKSLACMSELPNLASPQGALSILPSILYLATGVLKLSKGDETIAAAGTLLLQQSAQCRCVRAQPHTQQQHAELLQSALAKVLELVKNDEPDQRIEPIVGASAMAALLSHATPAPPLHYPCINHFRQCLESEDHETFAACCGVIRTIWSTSATPECVSWWARALAPRIVAAAAAARCPVDMSQTKAAAAALQALDRLLLAAPESARKFTARAERGCYVENKAAGFIVYLAPRIVAAAAAARCPVDMSQTKAAAAALQALDRLLLAAPESARVQLLRLVVPIVISYLRAGAELARAPAHVRALHDNALQWLTRQAPNHPQEFKTIMQQSPELRSKLENAVKANQSSVRARAAQRQRPERVTKPTIQLKTDFSDFR